MPGLFLIHGNLAPRALMRFSIFYVLVEYLDHHVSWAYSFPIQILALTAGQFTMLPGGGGNTITSCFVICSSCDLI